MPARAAIPDCRSGSVLQLVKWNSPWRRKLLKYGGEGGIRTHDGREPMPDFESGTFNHSATSPAQCPLGGLVFYRMAREMR
jgi:hypothetical protein